MIIPLRSASLNVISVWLVVAATHMAGAEPASGAPAHRRPARIRSVLFGIRDAKSLRRNSVAPLLQSELPPHVFAGTDPFCSLCKPPEWRPGPPGLTLTYSEIDRNTWQALKWAFDLLHPRRGEDRNEVTCSEEKLRCDTYDGHANFVYFRFVRTATGPKLQRIEVEPDSPPMHGI